VHYGTPSATTMLEQGQLFLLDSGAHYTGGTTDTTRTVCIGPPTDEQRFYYTHVLKAHLALSNCVFPPGSNGAQLDGLTRASLWQAGLDYGHGTGHGVGAFSGVHEGPNGIHKAGTTVFLPGMVTSIEPGYYQTGWGGIRLENLAICQIAQDIKTHPEHWLYFEALTWVPFCAALIDKQWLLPHEVSALQQYHQQVMQRLTPLLDPTTQLWVEKQCQFN
jgi:Xaa-Pro aminopeptidase